MHPGQGPGLSLHDLGETGGAGTVTLLESEIPSHSHGLNASLQDANTRLPGSRVPAGGVGVGIFGSPPFNTQLNFNALPPAGGSQPHNNLMPYLTLNFCIALQGVFPPRT